MLYFSSPVGMERIWGSLPGAGSVPVGEMWWYFQNDEGSSSLESLDTGDSTDPHELTELCGIFKDGPPVMVKTLHTSQVLSVQVHPGSHGDSLKKDETWIVLDAPEGSYILAGLELEPGGTILEHLAAGTLGSALRRIPVAPGDIYHIPPGTVHALGPDLEILEVQDSCDVTYRFYDWDRTGADGRPRELHLEKALLSIEPPPGGEAIQIGSEGHISQGAHTGGGYSIESVGGEYPLVLSGCGIFFLSQGHIMIGSRRMASPACVISDPGGGELDLSGGSGYIIRPGGGSWLAR